MNIPKMPDIINRIDDEPAVKQAFDAWQDTITPSNHLGDPTTHNQWISEIKKEQIKRGQRK